MMKAIFITLACASLGVVLSLKAVPPQTDRGAEIPPQRLVHTLRTLITAEIAYRQKSGRFADLESLLPFLRKEGAQSFSAVDLEKPDPYEITITTSSDGMHYQIAIKRPSEMSDKSTWCKTAAFTDDRGIIFLGQALDCDAAPK